MIGSDGMPINHNWQEDSFCKKVRWAQRRFVIMVAAPDGFSSSSPFFQVQAIWQGCLLASGLVLYSSSRPDLAWSQQHKKSADPSLN